MKSATNEQAQFLANVLNRDTAISYENFVNIVLGTHWDPTHEVLALNYVHVNRVIPLLENSLRDKIRDYFQRFYNLDGVLTKMAVIETTLDTLDVEPMRLEPQDFTQYAFMEYVLARIVAFYLAPQTQPLPVPAIQPRQPKPSSRLQQQPRQALDIVPESLSRTSSLEQLPTSSFVPRRIPLTQRTQQPGRDISYETEAEVMRTLERQDERRRTQGRYPTAPGPSAGRDEDTADSNTELVFEFENPDSGCIDI